MKRAIIGGGGFSQEVLSYLGNDIPRFIDHEYWYHDMTSRGILPLDMFDPIEYEVVVAVGNPVDRENIVNRLPKETKYFTYIHPSAQIFSESSIGEGSIICPGVIITTDVIIGKHAHLNILSTVGHETYIGNFFTTAPGAKVSGNCIIRDRVNLGTNSSVREKLTICDDVTVGLNSGVVKDINKSGIYVGLPAKIIKQKG